MVPVLNAVPHPPPPNHPPDLRVAKDALRERMRACIRAVTPEHWADASSSVGARLLDLTEYRLARVVMLYHPTHRELNLRAVAEACLRTGRTVCLPRANWITGQLQPAMLAPSGGAWGAELSEPIRGIREPLPAAAAIAPDRLDLVIVPGVAFDTHGGRLGRGAGFYDRFLAGIRAFTVGVCLDEQVVEHVPMGEGDTRLHAVVTPTRTLVRAE